MFLIWAAIAPVTPANSELLIDAFDYGDSQAAASAWRALAGTPAPEMVSDDGRRVLEFRAPFATDADLPRTILDRDNQFNLAGAGSFVLELWTDRPDAGMRLSLYFRSGDGWFAGAVALANDGWQQIRLRKDEFSVEGVPKGWHAVDGIRISVWRSKSVDAVVRLRRLSAVWNDVALLVPSRAEASRSSELRTALNTAEHMGKMLEELGILFDRVDPVAISQGGLQGHRVLVLPYHPDLDEETVRAVEQFLDGGGKLFACYVLPASIAERLGIARLSYFRPAEEGGLAEVRFESAPIEGLPRSMRQASWNIQEPIVDPARPGAARVIGLWYDWEGRSTGKAAATLSPHGAFFSHIILEDDRSAKLRFLAAILGAIHPPLWNTMVQEAIRRAETIGHCRDWSQLQAFLTQATEAEAKRLYQQAVKNLKDAESASKRGDVLRSVELASRAREQFIVAYARSMPSPKVEGRAFWNHSGTGAYPGDWERTAQELAEAGFNMILPNMLWAGLAHYPSQYLPESDTFRRYGDQIAQCVKACNRYGIEVHVWKVNHNLSGAPREFVEQLRREGRLQLSARGTQTNWLCPSDPRNFELERDSMLEVVEKYPVAGIHFDYIRYPDGDHCYCEGCRKRFEAELGNPVKSWPMDCHQGSLRAQYRNWRCQQITRLVAAVAERARRLRPGVKISAAVFGAYPECRESVGQDWVLWVKEGYLDFVCPMDYTQEDAAFVRLVENQLKLVEGRIPIYPGIGAWRLSADRTVGQIHWARTLGSQGFTIFNLTEDAARDLLPLIRLGVGSQKAHPPHRSK